jgi:hypothetical protein
MQSERRAEAGPRVQVLCEQAIRGRESAVVAVEPLLWSLRVVRWNSARQAARGRGDELEGLDTERWHGCCAREYSNNKSASVAVRSESAQKGGCVHIAVKEGWMHARAANGLTWFGMAWHSTRYERCTVTGRCDAMPSNLHSNLVCSIPFTRTHDTEHTSTCRLPIAASFPTLKDRQRNTHESSARHGRHSSTTIGRLSRCTADAWSSVVSPIGG